MSDVRSDSQKLKDFPLFDDSLLVLLFSGGARGKCIKICVVLRGFSCLLGGSFCLGGGGTHRMLTCLATKISSAILLLLLD